MDDIPTVDYRSARLRTVNRTLWIVLALNLAVAVAKLLYGLATRSVAMTADGFHSLFDGASNVVGLLGMALAARPPDAAHPYGHGKYETFASAAIGGMLVIAAWNVGEEAVTRLLDGGPPPEVGVLSFAVMVVTLAINVAVTVSERRIGRRVNSQVLIADAGHTATDVLVSLGVIAGLAAVRLGFPLADPIIALAVALAILRTGVAVLLMADETLADRARLPAGEVEQAVLAVGEVLGCRNVRTRGTAFEVYVDLSIQIDSAATVEEGHRVATGVEKALRERFPAIVDVVVHVEPHSGGSPSSPRTPPGPASS